jgi:hypothetical protein
MVKWRNWEKMFEGISLFGSHKRSVINNGKRKERGTLFILFEFNKANLIIYSFIITDIKCMRGLPGYESAVKVDRKGRPYFGQPGGQS